MSSSSRFAVAVHVLTVIGFAGGRGMNRVSSQMLATSVGTHPVVIRELLRSLKAAGLIRSTEGRGGGASLAKPASKMSLREIFLAVEGEHLLAANERPEFKPCPVSRNMKKIMGDVYKDVDRAVGTALKGRSLQDLVDLVPSGTSE
jgi:Rrf2 family protein